MNNYNNTTLNRGDNAKKSLATEVKWQPTTPKSLKPLTRKQQAFVQHLINNPKDSATTAAKHTTNASTDGYARLAAHRMITNDNVKLELAKHSATAEMVILKVLKQSETRMTEDKPRAVDWANTARQTADSILDRVHGKATQRQEVTTSVVTLNIDLTGNVDASV